MAKGLPPGRRRRRASTGPGPADVLWELDAGTDEQAWTTPWLTWKAPATLAFELARQGVSSITWSIVLPFHRLLISPESTELYDELQEARRALPYTQGIEQRSQRWLTAGCLIAESGIANSSGGGLLYGSLLLDVARSWPEDYGKPLEEARVRDALGRYGEPLAAAVAAFRGAWRAKRYRLAYALARAARGLP